MITPANAKLSLAAVAGLSRAPFLLLTPVCIVLGWLSATVAGASMQPLKLTLIMLAALCSHIAVNALNEYDDFQSGLDLLTKRTPFSGGSGTLPANPELAHCARALGFGALGTTIALGLSLAQTTPNVQAELLTLGLVGVAIIYTYTRWLNRLPWLCLIAPGLGFGLLMVLGSHLVLRAQFDAIALAVGVMPFLLVNNLLLLNQLPDIDADRQTGRRTLPVVYGEAYAVQVYLLQGVCVYGWIILGYATGLWPAGALLALLSAPLLWRIIAGINTKGPKRWRYLGLNVVLTLSTPLLFSAGIML